MAPDACRWKVTLKNTRAADTPGCPPQNLAWPQRTGTRCGPIPPVPPNLHLPLISSLQEPATMPHPAPGPALRHAAGQRRCTVSPPTPQQRPARERTHPHTVATVPEDSDPAAALLARFPLALGYQGVDKDAAPVQVIHCGMAKSLRPQHKRWLRRRQAIEPVIGNAKTDFRMGRRLAQGCGQRRASIGAVRGRLQHPLAAARHRKDGIGSPCLGADRAGSVRRLPESAIGGACQRATPMNQPGHTIPAPRATRKSVCRLVPQELTPLDTRQIAASGTGRWLNSQAPRLPNFSASVEFFHFDGK